MKKKLIMLSIIIIAALWIYVIVKVAKTPTIEEEIPTNNSTTAQWELSLEITAPEEEPADEKRSSAPAEIKQISEKSWLTSLTLDMLTINNNFQSGGNDYFINQNPKVRDFTIAADAKAFTCDTNNIPAVSVSLKNTIATIQQSLSGTTAKIIYSFDIADGKINTIYQQCHP